MPTEAKLWKFRKFQKTVLSKRQIDLQNWGWGWRVVFNKRERQRAWARKITFWQMISFWVFMNQQDGVFIYFYSSFVLEIRKLKHDLTLKTVLAGIVNEVPQPWGRIICTVITMFACMSLWLKLSRTLNQRTKDKSSLPDQYLSCS